MSKDGIASLYFFLKGIEYLNSMLDVHEFPLSIRLDTRGQRGCSGEKIHIRPALNIRLLLEKARKFSLQP